MDAATAMNGTISTISKSTHEGATVAQIPVLEDWTRSNRLWKRLFPMGNISLLVDTSMRVLEKQQAAGGSEEKPNYLLKSLLSTHKTKPDQLSLTDVMSITIAVM
jgi:hypothetical protein